MQTVNPFDLIITRLDFLQLTIDEIKNASIQEAKNESKGAQLLDLNEASTFLGMPVSTIHFHKKHNDLPFLKPGKRLLFRKEDLVAWVESYGKKNASAPNPISKMASLRKKYVKK